MAYFGASGAYSHTETLADADGDTVVDEDDKCRETDGDSEFYGCPAKTYCMEIDTAYENKRFQWATANLSLQELGSYYTGMKDFAEGGCGGNKYHWACYGVYQVQPVNWESVWDTLRRHVVDIYGQGLTAPNCPKGYAPQIIAGDHYMGFSFYSGGCINICRQALFNAGLLTSAGGGAAAIAATAAGRAAIGGSFAVIGSGLSVDALIPFCDGDTWVDPL